MIWFLAFRNVVLLRKRYFLMAFAVAAGFALITVLTSLSAGALAAVRNKAARYFSGDVCVIGLTGSQAGLQNPQEVITKIKNARLPVKNAVRRTVYYGDRASLFFGGKQIRLRRPIGVDFEKEKNALEKLPFVAGSVQDMLGAAGKNGIIISTAIASSLNTRCGDDVILSLVTATGQYSTATFLVRGIFDETNIFGYAAYVPIEELNALLQMESSAATEIAVYVQEGTSLASFAEKLRLTLEKIRPVFSPIQSRDAYIAARNGADASQGEKLAVISIEAQLDEIRLLLNAFAVLTYFVLAIFLLIIMAGITATFRVLIHERTKEIGTLRVLGMHKNEVKNMFLAEAAILAFFSAAAGFAVAFVLLKAMSLFQWPSLSVVSMFTEKGRLLFAVGFKQTLLNLFFIFFTVFFAVVRPARFSSSVPPAQALRQT